MFKKFLKGSMGYRKAMLAFALVGLIGGTAMTIMVTVANLTKPNPRSNWIAEFLESFILGIHDYVYVLIFVLSIVLALGTKGANSRIVSIVYLLMWYLIGHRVGFLLIDFLVP